MTVGMIVTLRAFALVPPPSASPPPPPQAVGGNLTLSRTLIATARHTGLDPVPIHQW